MEIETLPPPILLTRPDEVRQLARTLLAEPIVAVDTESNSLHAFQEQVCLVQFSTPQADYLVDPLVVPDLSPLADVFASPQVEKVFHGADYDVLTLRRDFGFTFANLFDTMIAARILGYPRVGLGALLESFFGVRLNKRFQRADWGQRPLPQALLDYARLDTRYLILLRHRLRAELEKAGLWPLAQEDFARLAALTPRENGRASWEVKGAHLLTPQQRAVLAELVAYRDRLAWQRNWPRFKVLSDRALLAVARHLPRRLEDLRRVPELTPGLVRRHGQALLQAVEREVTPLQRRMAQLGRGLALAALVPDLDTAHQTILFSYTMTWAYVVYHFVWFWYIPAMNWMNRLGVHSVAAGATLVAPWVFSTYLLWKRRNRKGQ